LKPYHPLALLRFALKNNEADMGGTELMEQNRMLKVFHLLHYVTIQKP
jgi:hypothetical protein